MYNETRSDMTGSECEREHDILVGRECGSENGFTPAFVQFLLRFVSHSNYTANFFGFD